MTGGDTTLSTSNTNGSPNTHSVSSGNNTNDIGSVASGNGGVVNGNGSSSNGVSPNPRTSTNATNGAVDHGPGFGTSLLHQSSLHPSHSSGSGSGDGILYNVNGSDTGSSPPSRAGSRRPSEVLPIGTSGLIPIRTESNTSQYGSIGILHTSGTGSGQPTPRNPTPAHLTPHLKASQLGFFEDLQSPLRSGVSHRQPIAVPGIPSDYDDGRTPRHHLFDNGHTNGRLPPIHGGGGHGNGTMDNDDSANPLVSPPLHASSPPVGFSQLAHYPASSPTTPGRSSMKRPGTGESRINSGAGVTFGHHTVHNHNPIYEPVLTNANGPDPHETPVQAFHGFDYPPATPIPPSAPVGHVPYRPQLPTPPSSTGSNSSYGMGGIPPTSLPPMPAPPMLTHPSSDGSDTTSSPMSPSSPYSSLLASPSGSKIYDICSRDEYLWLLQTRQYPAFEDEQQGAADMRLPEGKTMPEYDNIEDDHAVKCCRRRQRHVVDRNHAVIPKSISNPDLYDMDGKRRRHVSLHSWIAAANVVIVMWLVLFNHINPFERSSASSTSALPIAVEKVSWAACLHDITRLILFPLVVVAPWCRSAHHSMLRQLSVMKLQSGSVSATRIIKSDSSQSGSSSVWLWQQVQATLWPQWSKDPIAIIALILLFTARSGFGLWAKVDEILAKDYESIPERNFDVLRRCFQCLIGLVGLTITSLAFRSRGHRGYAIRREKVEWVEWSPFLLIGGMMFETMITTVYWNRSRPWQWQHIVTSDWTGIFKVVTALPDAHWFVWVLIVFAIIIVFTLKRLMRRFRAIGRSKYEDANSKWWAEWAQRTLARSAAAFVHYFILVAIHRFIPVYITLLLVQDVDGCANVARQFVQRLHRDVRTRKPKEKGEKGRLENYFELEAKVRSVNGNVLPLLYVITHVVFYVMLDYWHFEPKTTSIWVPYVLRHVVPLYGLLYLVWRMVQCNLKLTMVRTEYVEYGVLMATDEATQELYAFDQWQQGHRPLQLGIFGFGVNMKLFVTICTLYIFPSLLSSLLKTVNRSFGLGLDWLIRNNHRMDA